MRVAFRVDASADIGSGHIIRCLTLADLLRVQGDTCCFYCQPQPGDRTTLIASQGYSVVLLDQAEDLPSGDHYHLLVVDNYRLDATWERRQRRRANHIFVIDDLANRPHDADLLLDQNLRPNAEIRYRRLVPSHCRLLLGPSHVLLRPDFEAPPKRTPHGLVKRVLVYFGGNDQHNQTGHAIAALAQFPGLTSQVVLGFEHPHRDRVNALARTVSHVTVEDICSDMAGAMGCADLALGVCGVAAWERCAMGLPSLVCVTADNQREDSMALHDLGAVENLGESEQVNASHWAAAIAQALADPLRLLQMSAAALGVVKGHRENRSALLRLLHDHGA